MARTPEELARRREQMNSYRSRNYEYAYNYLLKHPCVDCGNADVRVLEFDHVRPGKTMGVGELIRHGSALTTLIKEIDMCEVRCANCHRIKTVEALAGGRCWRTGNFQAGTGSRPEAVATIRKNSHGTWKVRS